MKRRISRGLALVFVLAVVAAAVAHNLTKPRVLILHSYDPQYAWTRDVDVGLTRILADRTARLAIRRHYMDLKRHPWPQAKANAGRIARKVIDEWRPDLVIAVDDDAQEYAAKHYAGRSDIRIVFAGVNGDAEAYGYGGADNVTGILERLPLPAMRDALLSMQAKGRPLRLLELGDRSATVLEDHRRILAYDWRPIEYVDAQLVGDFEQWQQIVLAAAGRADVLLVTNYRMLARSAQDKTLVPPKEVIAWSVRHSPVPMVGTNGFFVEDGGMLAVAKSPFEQGEAAATLALAIVEKGKAPSSIPVTASSNFVILMRPGEMARHGVRLPDWYESFARATNGYYNEKD